MRQIDEITHIGSEHGWSLAGMAAVCKRLTNEKVGWFQLPMHKIASEYGCCVRYARFLIAKLDQLNFIERDFDQAPDQRQRANRIYWNGVPNALIAAAIEKRRALHRSTSVERKLWNERKARERQERIQIKVGRAIQNGVELAMRHYWGQVRDQLGAAEKSQAHQVLQPSTLLPSETPQEAFEKREGLP